MKRVTGGDRAVAAAVLLLAAPVPAPGQQRNLDVEASLDCFVERTLALARECPPDVTGAGFVLERPSSYAEEDVRALLEGLTNLAIHHDSSIVSTVAATYVMAPGEDWRHSFSPPRDLVQAMIESGRPGPLLAIVRSLPRQLDREWALGVLSDLAVRDDYDGMDSPPISVNAVVGLHSMGEAGRRRLDELITEDAFRNEWAKSTATRSEP